MLWKSQGFLTLKYRDLDRTSMRKSLGAAFLVGSSEYLVSLEQTVPNFWTQPTCQSPDSESGRVFAYELNRYSRRVGEIIAKGQITNGGPVILFQPENEYTEGESGILFPDKV